MKRKLTVPIAVLVFILASCKDAKQRQAESLEGNLKTFFAANLREKDSTKKIDSFRLIKIDTITEFDYLAQQQTIHFIYEDAMIEKLRSNSKLLSNATSQMQLYGMLGSQTLLDLQKKEAKEYIEKSDLIKKELDTLTKIGEQLQAKIKVADTSKPIAFEAINLVQLRNMDRSVQRDTSYIILNLNKDIIKRSDFIKDAYTVDLKKFD